MVQRMPGLARRSNSESSFCVRVRRGVLDLPRQCSPSVVDAMVGNVSSPNWFLLLRFSFGLTGVFSSKRHGGCTEAAMDSFVTRECQKTLMRLPELKTHAESWYLLWVGFR
ncbi:hypothetical protein K503DRAFT_749466, partial [Rhizopogon vinicolor AM-OR11-026]